jgi:hypothetical protein
MADPPRDTPPPMTADTVAYDVPGASTEVSARAPAESLAPITAGTRIGRYEVLELR